MRAVFHEGSKGRADERAESEQWAVLLIVHRHGDYQAASLLASARRRRGELVGIRRAQRLDAARPRHRYGVDPAELHAIRFELLRLLREFDQRVAAVFKDDRDEWRADPHRGLELLGVHRE